LLVGGGMAIALYASSEFSAGAWYTGVILLVFAGIGRAMVRKGSRDRGI
jgi:hypothetical protein